MIIEPYIGNTKETFDNAMYSEDLKVGKIENIQYFLNTIKENDYTDWVIVRLTSKSSYLMYVPVIAKNFFKFGIIALPNNHNCIPRDKKSLYVLLDAYWHNIDTRPQLKTYNFGIDVKIV